MASWLPQLHELVLTELLEREHSSRLGDLINQFRQSKVPIIQLVEALGPFLTSDEDAKRARATGVLAEVVEAVPSAAAGEGEVRHLTQFFSSRLTDWPAVRGALTGCLALLSRRGAAADTAAAPGCQLAEVSEGEAVEMVRACVSHVFIRALTQQDRALALRLLMAAMRGYGAALLDANLDLFEYLVSSVDGEKDPRCLLLSFEAVQCLLQLYHQQPETSLCHDRLEEGAEELFEVLACYFPVTFTPPPNDPNKITRQDLASGLEATLAAEPLFAPYLVPLACEKLSSTLRQAKLDSLLLLGACAEGYGPAPLASHVSTLWAALRPELAAPAADGLLAADQAAADELAVAAASCLARCIAAFQRAGDGATAGARLAGAVLEDPLLQDMLACITSPGDDAVLHRRSALKAHAGARAAEALCKAGGTAAGKALSQLLPPLLETAGEQDSSLQSRCLAWSAVLGMLEAAAAAPESDDGSSPLPAAGELLQKVAATATFALEATAAAHSADMDADREEEEEEEAADSTSTPQPASGTAKWPLLPADCTRECAATLQLAVLASIFGSCGHAAALSRQHVQAAVGGILKVLLGPASSSRQRRAAVAPLAALAGSSYASLLLEAPLQQLVAAAGQQQSAAAALAAMQALAASSAPLQLEVVLALDQAIQQQLPLVGSGDAQGQLLLQLLRAASAIVSAAAGAVDGGDQGAAAAALCVQLGQHLLDAVQLLPEQAAAAVGPELQAACAELEYHAVRAASAQQQVPLASAAAASVMGQQGQLAAGLQATVCCAVLLPLRQEAVSGLASAQSAAELVQQLVQMAVVQPVNSPAGHYAALAAAAMLNKWPAADGDGLAACTSTVLDKQLFPACGLVAADSFSIVQPPAAVASAWACLATVSRGLAMRGSKAADAVVTMVAAALQDCARRWQQLQEESSKAGSSDGAEQVAQLAAGTRAAAQFLGSVLDGGSSGGASDVALTKQAHAVAKPLWQQRLYTLAMSQLLPLLQSSMQGSAGAPQPAAAAVPGGDGAPPQPAASAALLLGLGHLLKQGPAGVLRQDQPRLLPWLLQCLEVLQRGPLADGELLLQLLLLVSEALMSSQGKQQAEAELLPRLIPALLGLAAYRGSPAVRETALQCLLLLVELPYTAIHPYRRQVARVLSAAVDDAKRAVRLQAARCRQAWSAF